MNSLNLNDNTWMCQQPPVQDPAAEGPSAEGGVAT